MKKALLLTAACFIAPAIASAQPVSITVNDSVFNAGASTAIEGGVLYQNVSLIANTPDGRKGHILANEMRVIGTSIEQLLAAEADCGPNAGGDKVGMLEAVGLQFYADGDAAPEGAVRESVTFSSMEAIFTGSETCLVPKTLKGQDMQMTASNGAVFEADTLFSHYALGDDMTAGAALENIRIKEDGELATIKSASFQVDVKSVKDMTTAPSAASVGFKVEGFAYQDYTGDVSASISCDASTLKAAYDVAMPGILVSDGHLNLNGSCEPNPENIQIVSGHSKVTEGAMVGELGLMGFEALLAGEIPNVPPMVVGMAQMKADSVRNMLKLIGEGNFDLRIAPAKPVSVAEVVTAAMMNPKGITQALGLTINGE